MRITSVTALNWMAYPEIVLDFSESEYVITGKNNHGKSGLLDAITWALWGRVGRKVDQRSADKLIRAGSDLMHVEVGFLTSDGVRVSVTREKPLGKSGTLNVYADGVRQTYHTIAESQEAIDRLIGLDYDAITAGPFMVQRQSDSFMAADPRARKDILIRLLGLEQYEVLHKAANTERGIAERDEAVADRSLRDIEVTVTTGPAAREDAAKAARAVVESDKLVAKAHEGEARARERLATAEAAWSRHDESLARLARLESAIGSERKVYERLAQQLAAAHATGEILPEPPPPAQDVPAAIIRVEEIREASERVAAIEPKRVLWEERVRQADEQLAVLPTVPCHGEGEYAACRFLTGLPNAEGVEKARASVQRWAAEMALLRPVMAGRSEAQDALDAAIASERAWSRYEAALAGYEARKKATEDLVAANESAMADSIEREQALKAQLASESALVPKEPEAHLETLRNDAVGFAEEVAECMAMRDRDEAWSRVTDARVAVVEAAEVLAEEWRVKATAAREKAAIYRLLESAWHRDGIPTDIIEAQVPLLEARANEILSRFPQSMTLALRTQKPVNKGAGMAETLDIIVTMFGWEREYGLLSVGARLRVDIALRLALGELLAHRSGHSVRTLWLDEPLADLDTEGQEAVIETLRAVQDDFDLIVAISHHAGFNDRFGAQIEVRQDDDGISTAEVTA